EAVDRVRRLPARARQLADRVEGAEDVRVAVDQVQALAGGLCHGDRIIPAPARPRPLARFLETNRGRNRERGTIPDKDRLQNRTDRRRGPMGILSWILMGLIAGAIAKLLMPGNDPGGCIITIVIGIAGALLGG